jgi:hypothetical protein
MRREFQFQLKFALTPFQHLIVIFFVLLGLNLYLKAEEEKGWGRYYILSILCSVVASFCRLSILILPVVIFCLIMLSKDRLSKLKRWSIFFIPFLLYPSYIFYVGDTRVTDRLEVLLASPSHAFTFTAIPKKILLLFYEIITPFCSLMDAFLDPFKTVMSIDNTSGFYRIPVYITPAVFILCILIFILFFKYLKNEKRLLLFVVWYSLTVLHFGCKDTILLRHFIFISPIFAIMLSMGIVWCLGFVKRPFVQKTILFGILLIFCISNILAIRLTILRGKLMDTFYIYDYIRTASLMKEQYRFGKNEEILVEDIQPLIYEEIVKKGIPYFIIDNSSPYDNFKFVAAKVLSVPIENIKIGNAGSLKVKDRPFLLDYLLEGNDPYLLSWIINNYTLENWLERIIAAYREFLSTITKSKTEYLANLLREEVKQQKSQLLGVSLNPYPFSSIETYRMVFKIILNDYKSVFKH